MFVDAVEKARGYTRPIYTITRLFGNDVVEPGAATLFFVNELGHAITCKHVAELLMHPEKINARHKKFSDEKNQLPGGGKYKKRLKELQQKYSLGEGVITQIRNSFVDCVDKFNSLSVDLHPTEDLAIIKFVGFNALSYTGHATFLRDSSKIKQGKSLCRLGYPFPEFSNYIYNSENDDIEWTDGGNVNSPTFPIDGIVTRLVKNNNTISGIEMSTPGLKGQSGGPLFNNNSIVYGMQSSTLHLHLGFDIKNHVIRENGKNKYISNYPFLHLGRCVHVDVIKSFLHDKGVKYYENDDEPVASS